MHSSLFCYFGKASTDGKLPHPQGALTRDLPYRLQSLTLIQRGTSQMCSYTIITHHSHSAGPSFAIFTQFAPPNCSSQTKQSRLHFLICENSISEILGMTNPQKLCPLKSWCHMHMYKCTCTHTHTYTHTHMHTRTHARTHTQNTDTCTDMRTHYHYTPIS